MLFSKPSFKNFVNEMYYKNVDERFIYKEKRLPLKTYFNKNKWFLKSKYKQETKNGNA